MTENTPSPADRHQTRRERARRQFIGALAFLAFAAAVALYLFDADPPPAAAVRISIPPPPADDDASPAGADAPIIQAPAGIVSPAPADADDALAAEAAAALRTPSAAAGDAVAVVGPFVVQVFAAGNRARAEEIAAGLSGYDAFVEELDRGGQVTYRVRVGGFASRAAAEAAKQEFAARGYPDSFVEGLR